MILNVVHSLFLSFFNEPVSSIRQKVNFALASTRDLWVALLRGLLVAQPVLVLVSARRRAQGGKSPHHHVRGEVASLQSSVHTQCITLKLPPLLHTRGRSR